MDYLMFAINTSLDNIVTKLYPTIYLSLPTGIYFTSFFLGTCTFLILAALLEPSPTSITFVIISPCPWAP